MRKKINSKGGNGKTWEMILRGGGEKYGKNPIPPDSTLKHNHQKEVPKITIKIAKIAIFN